MMLGGVRVSRHALVGDPGALRLTPRAGLGMRFGIPSKNKVTATATVTGAVKKGGFFSKLGGFGAALGGALLGGPAGFAVGAGPALFKGLGGLKGPAGLPFGGGATAALLGMGGMRRRRRIRVTNVRALRRALTRVRGFERLARRVIRITPRFHRRIRGRGTRGFRRRRAA